MLPQTCEAELKILAGKLRPQSIGSARARFVNLNKFLDGGGSIFAFNSGDRPQVALDRFTQNAPAKFAGCLDKIRNRCEQ
jgi:hypothetical protein